MSRLVAVLAAALLTGCGVETAGTAATAAALKKQELEEGKRTQQRSQQKIDDATKAMQESAQKRGGD
jgi:curli biogenesis system outer membrane secretion channel CsgG